jgi:dTDP-4-amino-4,6-dideoxygalactose transaminase
MSEVDCAQMMVKSRHLGDWQNRRRQIAMYYMDQLKDANLRCLIDQSNFDTHCFHKFVIDIDNRDDVAKKLKERGIETKVHYKHPLHELPAYQHYGGPNILSAASSLSRRALSLPIYPELSSTEVEYITEQVLELTK